MNHFAVDLKITQYCKSTLLPKKNQYSNSFLWELNELMGNYQGFREAYGDHRVRSFCHYVCICVGTEDEVLIDVF